MGQEQVRDGRRETLQGIRVGAVEAATVADDAITEATGRGDPATLIAYLEGCRDVYRAVAEQCEIALDLPDARNGTGTVLVLIPGGAGPVAV